MTGEIVLGDLSELVFQEIESATSPRALWALMLRHFRAAGFQSVGYVLFDRGRDGDAVTLLEHGFPPHVLQAYAAMGYGKHDATLRVAMATGSPILRSTVYEQFRLSRDEDSHRRKMAGLGVGEVLAMPLYGPNGWIALGALANPDREDRFARSNFLNYQMVAQAAHLRAYALRPAQAQSPQGLSSREVEILRWVAQGKSNSVIAGILDISPSTVDTYLRRIFEKLDVADRTSAAVKGVSMGLVGA